MTNPAEATASNPADTIEQAQNQTEQRTPENLPPSGEAPKKRRGRPPKNGSLSPESLGDAGASSSGSAKPGKRQGKMNADQIGNLAKQIQGIHFLAANITNLPECALHDKEAEMLAQSVAAMASQYDLSLDGKTGAAIQLMATAAMIYGPRYFAIRARMNQPTQGTVQEVTPNGPTQN